MGAYDDFTEAARGQFDRVAATQRPAIEQAAQWVAEALMGDRFLYAFGTGHSHMLAEEIFYRAGGLARGFPILYEPLMLHENAIQATYTEREPGLAGRILSEYPVQAGDVLIAASNGGRNPAPIDLVLEARRRGLRTAAITNVAQSMNWPSRHASGKRLCDVADVVIDNCGVDGDAAVTVAGFPHRVGPPSSITGMLIINLIVVEAIERAVRGGTQPEVFISSNTNGDPHNDLLLEKYRSRIKHL